MAPLAISDEVFKGHADILRNLPKQRRRDIASLMERHGGGTPSGISELLVGTPLSDQLEPQFPEDFDHLRRLQDWD
jgi:hypothetical protein